VLRQWLSNRKRTRGEGEATPHMLVTTGRLAVYVKIEKEIY